MLFLSNIIVLFVFLLDFIKFLSEDFIQLLLKTTAIKILKPRLACFFQFNYGISKP